MSPRGLPRPHRRRPRPALPGLHHQRPGHRQPATASAIPPAPPTAGASATAPYGLRGGPEGHPRRRPPVRGRGVNGACRLLHRSRRPASLRHRRRSLKRDIRSTVRWLDRAGPSDPRRPRQPPGRPRPGAEAPAHAFAARLSGAQSAFSFSACRRAPLPTRQDRLRQPAIRPRPDDPPASRPAGWPGQARLAPAAISTNPRAPACVRPSNPSARSSSSSARCCPPAATCCRRPSPKNSPACRTASALFQRRALAQLEAAYGKHAGRSVRPLRAEPSPPPPSPRFICRTARRHRVAVKILRPGIAPVIAHDLALLDAAATVLENGWKAAASSRGSRRRVLQISARRTRPDARGRQLLATAAQFQRFRTAGGARVHWDWCTTNVMVMERMKGIPSPSSTPCAPTASTSRRCPGPASRSSSPRFSATASSTPTCTPATSSSPPKAPPAGATSPRLRHHRHPQRHRQKYLATNFLAFSSATYRRVALAHIEAGWVPAHTRAGRVRRRHPRGVRTHLRPPAEGHLLRQDPAAPVPDRPPLRDGEVQPPARAAAKPCSTSRARRQLDPISTSGRPPSPSSSAG